MPGIRLDVAGGQIDGAREYQEDFYLTRPLHDENKTTNGVLAVLCDGMGGHAAGAVAARMAAEAFAKTALMAGSEGPAGQPVINAFHGALDSANRALADHVSQHGEDEGMGTTLLAVEVRGRQCRWISVGDSPLFLLRRARLTRLNADHSMAPMLEAAAKAGDISWEEARTSGSRNALRSAVTGDPIKLLDFNHTGVELEENDVLMICSDGVETLDPSELSALAGDDVVPPANQLVSAVLHAIEHKAAPQQDNASLIVIAALSGKDGVQLDDGDPASAAVADSDRITTRPLKGRS